MDDTFELRPWSTLSIRYLMVGRFADQSPPEP
jgi:hypothetical protein